MIRSPIEPQKQSMSISNKQYSSQKFDNQLVANILNIESSSEQQHQTDQFSMECDELLESMSQFCEKMQAKGYRNIKYTNEIMKKYIMLKSFKESIDENWQKILRNMIKFLKSDEEILKYYSQTKAKILQSTCKIQDCQNSEQFDEIIKFLQSSAKLQIMNNKIAFNQYYEQQLQQKIKTWKIMKQQIQDHEQIIKDYAIKIIEIVTDQPLNVLKQEHDQIKKLNTHQYFKLRQQINGDFNVKAEGSSNAFCSTKSARSDSIKEEETFKSSGKSKMRNSSRSYRKKSDLIQKILDLYKHQQL